jgi:phosphoribosyl 1,2-cyclic phosphate phosphodiesterase
MKVTILGSGPSSGVPTIPDGWVDCDPENQKNRRLRPSILVEAGNTVVLIDTSPDLRQQLLNTGIRRLDSVLYTHSHADHLHGIDDLRGINRAMNAEIPIYADADTLKAIIQRFGYTVTPLVPSSKFYYKPVLKPYEVAPGDKFSVGDIEFLAIDQDHGHSRTLGYRFGPMALTTDLISMPEESFSALAGVEIWIIGVFSFKPHPTHVHIDLALEWIKRVKPRRAILTHLGPTIDYAESIEYLPEGVEPAYDGMEIEI